VRFLAPYALLALPLALIPLWLAWRAERSEAPARFSSVYLVERARAEPTRRIATRCRWVQLLRALVIGMVVMAAARPVGLGAGGPEAHFPTRLIVAVDVSASVDQRREGVSAWSAIQIWADSVLAMVGPDDEAALAAIADGIVGWWEAPPEALRRQLTTLAPTARPSDWPRTLPALAKRLEGGGSTEVYLLTDGAQGAGGLPTGEEEVGLAAIGQPADHRVVRTWSPGSGANRGLVAADRDPTGGVSLGARAWGEEDPEPVVAGQLTAGEVVDGRPLPADGTFGAARWAVGDTATFALLGSDRLAADDRLYVARAGPRGIYRVTRWAPADEPPESGALFWKAALGAAPRGAVVEQTASLADLVDRAPDVALLPVRRYRADQAALLAELVTGGTRLLFAPSCPDPACVPDGAWLPHPSLITPILRWELAPADRQTGLATKPIGIEVPVVVPSHLLARAPIRPAIKIAAIASDWRWELTTGDPAFWVKGSVAIWLVPFGPPVSRIGTTPVFALVADAVMATWDPRWQAAGASLRPGQSVQLGPTGGTVAGPLHATPAARWEVPPGGLAPRLERAGLYRVDAERTSFVAVNSEPAEGDLTPIDRDTWRTAWGATLVGAEAWRAQLFPRRRGPELRSWFLALALVGLALEAFLRHSTLNK
jgi:hypothetical protein